jgi:predicted Rdx family selenoprotein
MPKFIIEREMPGVGQASASDLQGAATTSCNVLRAMGPEIQRVESYVTGDKVYCVYVAPDEQMIREHAERGGFPANKISKVERMIDPTTAEAAA